MEEARANVDVDEHERGFRKIAWAFLKVVFVVAWPYTKESFVAFNRFINLYISLLYVLQIVGTNGVLNIDSKLRLQLYCPPPRAKRQPKTIEVFEWWRMYPRNKYPSTLYVTVKGIKLPEHVSKLLYPFFKKNLCNSSDLILSKMIKLTLFDVAGRPEYSVYDGTAGGERKHLLWRTPE